MENVLYYRNNVQVLRQYVSGQSAHLIYVNPPLKGNQNCSALFTDRDGTRA